MIIIFFINLSLFIFLGIVTMPANGFGLGEGGDFYHPPRRIDAENQF